MEPARAGILLANLSQDPNLVFAVQLHSLQIPDDGILRSSVNLSTNSSRFQPLFNNDSWGSPTLRVLRLTNRQFQNPPGFNAIERSFNCA